MPDTPLRPRAASIAVMLLVAAIVGFLGGALLAVTRSDGDASPVVSGAATTPAGGAVATPGGTPGATAPTTSPAPPSSDAEISLTADRASADTEELIRLEGVLRPAAGEVRLQVQQSVDGIGFVDFPVTATTRSDGSFGVWVRTGRVGLNEFRMATDADGSAVISNAVAVQVS